MDYSIFKEQIATTPILASVASLAAWIVPLSEFGIVILLFWAPWRLKGLYAALGMMISFTAYIIYILAFNKHLPCSCGGVLEQLTWSEHIIFNCAFISLSLLAILLHKRTKKTNHQQRW